MKRKHVIIIAVLIVIIGVSITIKGIMSHLESNLKQLSALDISDIDLSKIEDGVYTGSYKAYPISAEVKVRVNNHIITKIDMVKHVNGQGSPAEIIPDNVVEAQSLEVDIVSGATYIAVKLY